VHRGIEVPGLQRNGLLLTDKNTDFHVYAMKAQVGVGVSLFIPELYTRRK